MANLEGMSAEAITDLAMLAESLGSNPKTRQKFLQLTKEANPNVSIPEVDIPRQVNGLLQQGHERLQRLERENQEMKIRATIEERRKQIMKKGLTESDIPEIEKLMLEKGISSHDTAAEFYQSQKRAAEPTPSIGGYQQNTVPTIDTKQFGGNLAKWARGTAASVIDDFRAGRVKV